MLLFWLVFRYVLSLFYFSVIDGDHGCTGPAVGLSVRFFIDKDRQLSDLFAWTYQPTYHLKSTVFFSHNKSASVGFIPAEQAYLWYSFWFSWYLDSLDMLFLWLFVDVLYHVSDFKSYARCFQFILRSVMYVFFIFNVVMQQLLCTSYYLSLDFSNFSKHKYNFLRTYSSWFPVV